MLMNMFLRTGEAIYWNELTASIPPFPFDMNFIYIYIYIYPLVCAFARKFRNKQFLSFKFCAILSSVMKSLTLPLRATPDVNHCFVQRFHTADAPCPVSHSQAVSVIRSTVEISQCFSHPYFT